MPILRRSTPSTSDAPPRASTAAESIKGPDSRATAGPSDRTEAGSATRPVDADAASGPGLRGGLHGGPQAAAPLAALPTSGGTGLATLPALPAEPAQTLSAENLLFTQGFGARRECRARVLAGHLQLDDGRVIVDPQQPVTLAPGALYGVEGVAWRFQPKAVLLLNKPAGYECSKKPRHHPSVLSLLPLALRNRGVQPVGRLDADTTGALLFTDDGALVHRLTSPKHHVEKTYQVHCAEPVSEADLQRLCAGVLLDGEAKPVRAVRAWATGPKSLALVLTEGKYHQVKRMLAAVGNAVVALHRSQIGPWALPADLPQGQWRWVDARDLGRISDAGTDAVDAAEAAAAG